MVSDAFEIWHLTDTDLSAILVAVDIRSMQERGTGSSHTVCQMPATAVY